MAAHSSDLKPELRCQTIGWRQSAIICTATGKPTPILGTAITATLRSEPDLAPITALNEHWQIELGWGLVALNDRYINADHNLGSEFNFETTLALAYQWQAEQSLRLNLYHWSNAGLASSNPGCEIVLAAYQFKF
jgi:hypothetical protein